MGPHTGAPGEWHAAQGEVVDNMKHRSLLGSRFSALGWTHAEPLGLECLLLPSLSREIARASSRPPKMVSFACPGHVLPHGEVVIWRYPRPDMFEICGKPEAVRWK